LTTEKPKERRLNKKSSKSSLFDLTTNTANEGNESVNNIQIEPSTTTVTISIQ
jgi:hypothetical protein